MRIALSVYLACFALFGQSVPKDAKKLWNGKDLKGWHISEVNHHGNTKAWSVDKGVLTVTQDKPGNGGILLTDRKNYKNFELYLEVRPDWGCDGGIFLRSTEKGEAYQVMLDYLEGGVMGGIYGERLPELQVPAGQPQVGTGKRLDREWQKYWKKDDWNQIKIRIEGDAPHIQVWINGNVSADWTDSANHSKVGPEGGMIALQTHRSNPEAKNQRWVPGGMHRYRNIYVVELP